MHVRRTATFYGRSAEYADLKWTEYNYVQLAAIVIHRISKTNFNTNFYSLINSL